MEPGACVARAGSMGIGPRRPLRDADLVASARVEPPSVVVAAGIVLEFEAAIAFKVSAAIAQTHVLRERVAIGVEGKLEAVQVVLARYVPP